MGQDITPQHLISDLLEEHWHYELVDELYRVGCKYLDNGLPVLPVNGKTPCDRTGGGRRNWQNIVCDEKKLRRGLLGAIDPRPRMMARDKREQVIQYRDGQPAIGLRMGPGSCLDIEDDNPNEAQAVRYLFRDCEMPPTPTFWTPRGDHQLWKFNNRLAVINQDVFEFSTPDGQSVKIRIGCSEGAHSVIPPSIDRNWYPLLSFDELNYKFADLPELVIQRLLEHYQSKLIIKLNTYKTDNVQTYEGIRLLTSPPASLSLCPTPSAISLEECYLRTVPRKYGKRHDCILEFSRWLKALDEYKNLDPNTVDGRQVLYPLVVKWYKRARRYIINADLNETWEDFCEGWNKVKCPVNRENLKMIYEQSQHEVIPGSVLSMVNKCQSPSIHKLIGLCALLQKLHGIEAFRLDCRAVGSVLGVGKSTVSRNINKLIDKRILKLDSECSFSDGLAAEYIYLPAFERAQAAA